MNLVETDFERNLIRVTLESLVSVAEALEVIHKVFVHIEMFERRGFCILLDLRNAHPFPPEVADMWIDVGRQARDLGLVKSAQLVRSQDMHAQVNKDAREAKSVELVRNFTDEQAALNWLTTAIGDPRGLDSHQPSNARAGAYGSAS